MLLTTYRHSFRSPEINYPKKHEPGTEPCICPITTEGEKKKSVLCPPINTPSKVMNTVDVDCSALVKPEPSRQICNLDTTERFIGNMRSVYPDLYQRIKNLPTDELNRILLCDANKTIYMVDYCKLKGYNDGLFECQKQQKKNVCGEESAAKPRPSKVDPEEFKCFGPFRPHKYTTEKRSIAQQKETIQKNFHITEYMDKFSRTGCVILKSNLHNHKKCPNAKSCQHPLKYCPIIY